MKIMIKLLAFYSFLAFAHPIFSVEKYTDASFMQEYHTPFPFRKAVQKTDVRAVAVDQENCVWAATDAGVFRLNQNTRQWHAMIAKENAGPAFTLTVDGNGTVWAGTWNGIYRFSQKSFQKVDGIDQPVSALCANGQKVIAMGPDGLWQFSGGKWKQGKMSYAGTVRKILSDKNGGYWIATAMGLFHQTQSGVELLQSAQDLLSADVIGIDFTPDGSLWIGGLGGVTVYHNGRRIKDITPADGLPSINIHSVTRGPDGRMWVGTDTGVARFDGASWSLRHNRRWLLDDDVRDVAFDSHGTAWIGTAKGVSAIGQKRMTLAQKAKHFLRICYARHVRPPYLVEKCQFATPGDTTNWKPRDDDNDGQYTSMYLAMESFRYAATKNPQAKANAKKAFDALDFLQTVTETPGFVARTVVPASWTKMADPNRTISDREWAEMRVSNPREKRVEKHWRPSRDGKWLWKGDTSSDEITGHMFGYLFYYDLAADKAEKKRVSEHICNIVDYIIDGGYVLRDIDGKHTKWAVWSPEKLNHDPNWRAERGINSVEILSYLKLAWHVSGKARYQKEYEKLLYQHHYAENIRASKTLNPAWRTHIDDELLALAFPCLLMYEENPKLRQLYQLSLDQWYQAVKGDHSPFFNFTYALLTGEAPHPQQSLAWLRDVPLDLIRWRRDNSRRRDIQLVYAPELDILQTSRLLPPSEAGIMRWDNNPWAAVRGDGGHTESDGVFWLLPYWMGRYIGILGNQE